MNSLKGLDIKSLQGVSWVSSDGFQPVYSPKIEAKTVSSPELSERIFKAA